MIKDNLDFWTTLRFEITHSGILNDYCDWIEPHVYYLGMNSLVIEGKISFLTQAMKKLQFKLAIDISISDPIEIESINLEHWIVEYNQSGFNGSCIDISLTPKDKQSLNQS